MSSLVRYVPYQPFEARLIGCSGDCGSELGILVNCVAYGRNIYTLSMNVIKVIENAFGYYGDPIRAELVHQMRQKYIYKQNIIYQEIYYRLNNENYMIIGRKRVHHILSLLRMLASDHINILTKIVNIACKIPTRSLKNEIDAYYQRRKQDERMNNEQLEMEQNNVSTYVDKRVKQIIKTKKYHIMKEKGLELTKQEIFSIILHCDYDTFINKLRESHRKRFLNSCEWKIFFQHLYSAIYKIHKVFHYKNYQFYQKYIKQRQWYNNKLFRGLHNVTLRDNNCSTVPLHTITSFTDKFGIAKQFSLDKGMILCINDAFRAIYIGALKAADVSWISRYPTEREWVVLPTNLDKVYKINPHINPNYNHYIHDDNKLKIYETNVLQKHMIICVNLNHPNIIQKAFLSKRIAYYMKLLRNNDKKQITHSSIQQTVIDSGMKMKNATKFAATSAAAAGGALGFCMGSAPVATATVAGSEALGSIAVWAGIMTSPVAPVIWPWIVGGVIVGGMVGYAGSNILSNDTSNDASNDACNIEERKLKRYDNNEEHLLQLQYTHS